MSGNMIVLTDDTFETEINKKGEGPILVDFWATWCGPCRMVAPILEKLSGEYQGKARIGKMDVDANPATPTKFGIMSIPTLLVFKDGKVAEQMVGAQSEQAIQGMLRRHIA
jgi:thioredoxin 1